MFKHLKFNCFTDVYPFCCSLLFKKKTQNPNFCWFLVLREKSPTWVAICRVPLWASWRTNTSSAVASHLKAARKTGRFSLFGNPLEKKNGEFYEVKKLRQKMGNSLKIPIGTDFFPALATKSEYIAARNKWLQKKYVFPFEGMAYFRYLRVQGVYQQIKVSPRVLLWKLLSSPTHPMKSSCSGKDLVPFPASSRHFLMLMCPSGKNLEKQFIF